VSSSQQLVQRRGGDRRSTSGNVGQSSSVGRPGGVGAAAPVEGRCQVANGGRGVTQLQW
jgi:hypothetical protein